MSRAPRILLVGPLPRAGTAVGGTQISFEELVANFRASARFELDVVDTSRAHAIDPTWRGTWANANALLHTLRAVATRGREADLIFYNASARGLLLGGPGIQTLARSLGKPLVVRAFGGGLDDELARAAPLLRAAFERTVLHSDLLLLQTRALCRAFAGSARVVHFPTSRQAPSTPPPRSTSCERFLFLSQLRPEKGVNEALAAIELAPEGCTLTVHGPLMAGSSLAAFQGSSRSRYAGELPHREVQAAMAQHDALVFPSVWRGEGWPGVVVEALQLGKPVIAARWRALPELVEHGVHGLLVEPRGVLELAAAMRRLHDDEALYARLCDNAARRGAELSSERVHAELERRLVELLADAEPPPALPAPAETRSDVGS